MIIKTNSFELEISKGVEVYIGSRTNGQTFKKWGELDENVKIELEKLQDQIEKLIGQSEEIILAPSNTQPKL